MKQYTADEQNWKFKIWKQVMLALIGEKINILEIGSLEGRSAVWLLENVLTHEESQLVCIDPWDLIENYYSENHDMVKMKENFLNNIVPWNNKVCAIQGFSFDTLCRIHAGLFFDGAVPKFNVIHVDGNHKTFPILQDCVLSWPLLTSGGLIIFDDYEGAVITSTIQEFPKLAIDNFLQTIAGEYETLWQTYQLVIRKK